MECTASSPHDTLRRDPHQGRTSAPAHAPAAGLSAAPQRSAAAARNDDAATLQRGYVSLDAALLRSLRQTRMFSQQDLADDCWRRNIQLSLTTIKRAEAGRAVRFRIARAFARCFDLPVERIAQIRDPAMPEDT